MPIFGTKNVLFGYFQPKMSYFSTFGLEFENNIVIFGLESSEAKPKALSIVKGDRLSKFFILRTNSHLSEE